jgi:hypothetical protein
VQASSRYALAKTGPALLLFAYSMVAVQAGSGARIPLVNVDRVRLTPTLFCRPAQAPAAQTRDLRQP